MFTYFNPHEPTFAPSVSFSSSVYAPAFSSGLASTSVSASASTGENTQENNPSPMDICNQDEDKMEIDSETSSQAENATSRVPGEFISLSLYPKNIFVIINILLKNRDDQ